MSFFRESFIVFRRQLRMNLRNPAWVIIGLLRDLDRTGVELSSIEVRRPTLDDVFLDLTGRSLREG